MLFYIFQIDEIGIVDGLFARIFRVARWFMEIPLSTSKPSDFTGSPTSAASVPETLSPSRSARSSVNGTEREEGAKTSDEKGERPEAWLWSPIPGASSPYRRLAKKAALLTRPSARIMPKSESKLSPK